MQFMKIVFRQGAESFSSETNKREFSFLFWKGRFAKLRQLSFLHEVSSLSFEYLRDYGFTIKNLQEVKIISF